MARSMTHMTASDTTMAFEQLRCKNEALQASARRMIERMEAIGDELNQQWELIDRITGQEDRAFLVEELQVASARVHNEAGVS